MGHTQHRATEVAKTLSRFIKADLAEGLSLALLHRKFPGMTRDEILHVLDICKDEATLEYERAQEVLASMRETTAGYAALFGLLDLWRSQTEEQRRLIKAASFELTETLDRLETQFAESPSTRVRSCLRTYICGSTT
jgi:hypothetical protein